MAAKKKTAASKSSAKSSAKKSASKKSASKKKATDKKAVPKKAASKKSAAPKKKAAAKKKTPPKAKAAPKKAAPVKPKAERKPGSASSMDVTLGHVFSIKPRINTSFRKDDFQQAKRALQDESYEDLRAAVRAVAEEALTLTRGAASKPQFEKRR